MLPTISGRHRYDDFNYTHFSLRYRFEEIKTLKWPVLIADLSTSISPTGQILRPSSTRTVIGRVSTRRMGTSARPVVDHSRSTQDHLPTHIPTSTRPSRPLPDVYPINSTSPTYSRPQPDYPKTIEEGSRHYIDVWLEVAIQLATILAEEEEAEVELEAAATATSSSM
ncbi:Uncharacterised protein r2_g3540 [Pycnogonum litorale]